MAVAVYFNKWPKWPMMTILALGILFLWTQNGYRYLFAPRTQAVVDTCRDECFATWTENGKTVSAMVDGADGLQAGQPIEVYPVGDIGHVAADGGGLPLVIWAFLAVALIYLVLVALRVAQATANRRRARAEGKRFHRAGELAVLAVAFGFPVTVLGGLLMLGEHSRSAGLTVLAVGLIVLVGAAGGYLAANWKPPVTAG
ncbi:hypothetical protein AB0F72_20565 [Actinoplanes sp. NPDC023936]|uniref:hypothetical protein n=1 Tax=Actinoplanes sp. NPDC023936 TaxID=3154910 RepID=UPI0033C2422B